MSDYTTTTTRPSLPNQAFPGIFELILKDVEDRFDPTDPVVLCLMGDLQGRREYGLKKYGTELKPFDGNDMLKEAYQEALDQVVYWRQLIFERDHSVEPVAWQLIHALVDLVNQPEHPVCQLAVHFLQTRGSVELCEAKGIA